MKLPIGVRCHIYSFLGMNHLIDQIALLSKQERDYITQTDILDQKRVLKINVSGKHSISFDSLNYCLKLCSEAFFNFRKFDDSDTFLFQYVMVQFGHKIQNHF